MLRQDFTFFGAFKWDEHCAGIKDKSDKQAGDLSK